MHVKNLLGVTFPDTLLAVSVRKTGYRSVLFAVNGYVQDVTSCLRSKVAAEREFDISTIDKVETML